MNSKLAPIKKYYIYILKYISMTNVALITGITGQDGSYLCEFLLEKKYDVWGIIRRASSINTQRINHIFDNSKLTLKYGDLTDTANLLHIFFEIKGKYKDLKRLEVYNLGAMSHVAVSFAMPEYTGQVDGMGTTRLLECIRSCGIPLDKIRFYQASTSELYGLVQEKPQTEKTPFYPRSPYGIAKLYSFWMVKNYRESYGLFACNGILFNHESPRRGITFVTRKITTGLAMILKGQKDKIVMGNLDSLRDWGFAKDYVIGMWKMLQVDTPDDYILATNEMHSVREFIEKAFFLKGFNIKWKGKGVDEIGYDENSGRTLITISEKYFRPSEVDELQGDYTKAKLNLDWQPQISFDQLVKSMVDNDCA